MKCTLSAAARAIAKAAEKPRNVGLRKVLACVCIGHGSIVACTNSLVAMHPIEMETGQDEEPVLIYAQDLLKAKCNGTEDLRVIAAKAVAQLNSSKTSNVVPMERELTFPDYNVLVPVGRAHLSISVTRETLKTLLECTTGDIIDLDIMDGTGVKPIRFQSGQCTGAFMTYTKKL